MCGRTLGNSSRGPVKRHQFPPEHPLGLIMYMMMNGVWVMWSGWGHGIGCDDWSASVNTLEILWLAETTEQWRYGQPFSDCPISDPFRGPKV